MKEFSVPTKTKIAVNIMRSIGVLFFVPIFLIMISGFRSGCYSASRFILVILLLLVFLFLFVFFPTYLLRKKRWSWWGSVTSLFLFILFILYDLISRLIKHGISSGFGSRLIIVILPICIFALILFLIDKKNYWEISR